MIRSIDSLCIAVDGLTVQSDTLVHFLKVLDNCDYVKNCKSNKEKDSCSLSSLVDKPLSQGECIQLGIAIEHVIRQLILQSIPNLRDIRTKNTKGKQERDHLFCDDTKKVIYYAEVKGNLKLDTEKRSATVKKCEDILTQLREEYPGYDVKMFLVSARCLYNSDIATNIKKMYSKINSNLVGLNDYLACLGYNKGFITEEDYKKFMNSMANIMFKDP